MPGDVELESISLRLLFIERIVGVLVTEPPFEAGRHASSPPLELSLQLQLITSARQLAELLVPAETLGRRGAVLFEAEMACRRLIDCGGVRSLCIDSVDDMCRDLATALHTAPTDDQVLEALHRHLVILKEMCVLPVPIDELFLERVRAFLSEQPLYPPATLR
ncbi:hypothetical protein [Rhodococcus sp. ACPA1]|uniref:hypothetical protein n=1 Tax=Rhodococcus sp. ACPA1 TaxID=2028572 RepID=UPI000BB0D3D6|nr:hypothetical protein [Rhodococcus sp. ACPA1]PBC47183.1 hypothetical protein CJ177_43455 [Rhodococcus sp. ACPA1]